MGNSQAKKNNALNDQERQRLQGENTQFQSTYGPERTAEKGWATGARNDIYGGYKNLTDPNFLSSSGFIGGGGGYTAPKLQAFNLSLDPRYQNLESGDYSKLKGGVHEAQAGYRDFASGGGFIGEDLNNARSGYNEFATTGGYSPEQISNIRNRATSSIPSFYDAIRNRMSQKMNAGGVNAGSIFSAASDKNARMAAQAGADTSLNAETDIADRVRQGRQWGIGGQMDVANAVQQGRQFGLGGLERTGGLGLAGMENIASISQQIANQNEMERASIANQNAQAQASASNANAGASNAAAQDRYRAYMGGLGGMMDVYTSSPSELGRYDELMMGNRGMVGNQMSGNIQQRMAYNPNVNWFDRAMQGVGAGAGLIGAF